VCVRGTFVVSVSLCTPRPGRYTLSLHDALPIWLHAVRGVRRRGPLLLGRRDRQGLGRAYRRQLRQRGRGARVRAWRRVFGARRRDRKSTRLNSSHVKISYAVFCLKKKTLGREVE